MQRKFHSPGEGDVGAPIDVPFDKISEFTIRRLSNYYRILLGLEKDNTTTVSSAKLAELCGVTSAQVRKDLSYFGNFGTRGLGYQVDELKREIETILGLSRRWSMALFGAGSLGHALFFFEGFKADGFYFTHCFDVDPGKVGTTWQDLTIKALDSAEKELREVPVDIGVIATPGHAAQGIVDVLVASGVRGILNFASRQLVVPKEVRVRNVNLAMALESISFFLSR